MIIWGKLDGRRFAPALELGLDDLPASYGQPVQLPRHVQVVDSGQAGIDAISIDAETAVRLGLIPGAPSRRRRGVPPAETIDAFCLEA